MIQDGLEDRCIDRAISTISLALGGEGRVTLEDPKIRDADYIVEQFAKHFPERKVRVWCGRAPTCEEDNLKYCGDHVPKGEELEPENNLIAFAYGKDGKGHIVVGLPAFGYDMTFIVTVAVSIEEMR